MALSGLEVFAGLLALALALLPLGLCLIWLSERLAGRAWRLSIVERVLLALYASGALFFVLASIPAPWFGFPLLVGLVAAGAAGWVLLTLAKEAPRLFAAVRELRQWTVWTVGLLTLALIGYEVAIVGTNLLPNTFDGSIQVLFVRLLVDNHTVPWTLSPYAQAGVIYPQATAVWLSFPALLLGWPLVSTPVGLPPLFLGLSVAGAYCWGERWAGFGTAAGRRTGLLFGVAFAALFTWPRFLVGGSYDFVLAVPLLFVLLGLLPEFVRRAHPRRSEVLALGIAVGTLFSLSVAAGEAAVLILIAYLVAFHPSLRRDALGWAARVGAILGMAALFLLRSLIGIGLWFSYPGHVLSELGSPPYASSPPGLALTLGEAVGELDPFVLSRPKLSPVPAVAVVLAVLIVLGILVILLRYGPARRDLSPYLSRSISDPTIVGTVVMLLITIVLLFASAPGSAIAQIGSVASLDESSILLFVFFQIVALLPLVVVLNALTSTRSAVNPGNPPEPDHRGGGRWRRGSGSESVPRGLPWGAVEVTLVAGFLIVLGVGVAGTAIGAPPFLRSVTLQLANVTEADLNALAWAGSHLPACSRVLVAPGSAAQFLPAYATLGLVFPMEPTPLNLSYSVAVSNLSAGNYTSQTRGALVALGVTEVFVTGASNFLYKPFLPRAFQNESDFTVLFEQNDAYIYAFEPVLAIVACPS